MHIDVIMQFLIFLLDTLRSVEYKCIYQQVPERIVYNVKGTP